MSIGKVLLAAGVLGVGGLGVAVAMSGDDGPEYRVERVVDGDTIDVASSEGETGIRVRFLNVDAPEMDAIGTPAGCFAQEATDYLTELLPSGTVVRLETDIEEYDRYDRLLAGVFVEDSDVLVNAEIAREGLGLAQLYEPNDRFFGQVESAEKEAAVAGVGIHSAASESAGAENDPEAVQCDLLERHQEIAAEIEELEEGNGLVLLALSQAAFGEHGSELKRIRGVLDSMGSYKAPDEKEDGRLIHDKFVVAIEDAQRKNERELESAESKWEEAKERREEQKRRELEEKAEAEARAKQQAEAEAEAEQRRIEEESRRAQRSSQAPVPPAPQYTPVPAQPAPPAQPAAPQQPTAPTGGGVDTYTGCRDYGNKLAPNAVDNKGRPYTRIDCTTKLPR